MCATCRRIWRRLWGHWFSVLPLASCPLPVARCPLLLVDLFPVLVRVLLRSVPCQTDLRPFIVCHRTDHSNTLVVGLGCCSLLVTVNQTVVVVLLLATTPVERVTSNYYIEQGERCERIDEKIVARRGPPAQDDYYLARVFAEIFCSDMSRRPSKVNNELMHCRGEVQSQIKPPALQIQ
jgi:hypothetical protein